MGLHWAARLMRLPMRVGSGHDFRGPLWTSLALLQRKQNALTTSALALGGFMDVY